MDRKLKFIEVPLAGAYLIEFKPVVDERGLFERVFCQEEFTEIGFRDHIVQINHSVTRQKGTIRGMHYQRPPACEIKLVWCLQGRVFDVMVDLRAGSDTFMHWHGVELSKENKRMIYIPQGFAHGFQTLTDGVELVYQHSAFYSPKYEHGLRFDDPRLAIRWPLPLRIVSQKDTSYPFIENSFKGIEL